MTAELRRSGHRMPATLLTITLNGPARAERPMTDPSTVLPPPASEAIESIKEAERVSIAAPYEQPISQAPTNVYVVRRSAAG